MDDVGELRRLMGEEYQRGWVRGWNASLAAALEALKGVPIDWLGDEGFVEMERRQREAIESLRRPEGKEE